jgi:hypothetical protein
MKSLIGFTLWVLLVSSKRMLYPYKLTEVMSLTSQKSNLFNPEIQNPFT